MTTYQASFKYSDFQSAILIYLASEERFFRIEEQHTDKKIQTRALNLSSGTFFPNSIRIQIADISLCHSDISEAGFKKLVDVSARLQELEQASLLQRGFPFYPGTEYEWYSITVQGSRYISEYLYTLIPVVTNQTRLRRILEKVEGFEKAKSWLLELGPRFKDRPLEELVNELLVGVRQFPAIGINLLLVLGKETPSGTR